MFSQCWESEISIMCRSGSGLRPALLVGIEFFEPSRGKWRIPQIIEEVKNKLANKNPVENEENARLGRTVAGFERFHRIRLWMWKEITVSNWLQILVFTAKLCTCIHSSARSRLVPPNIAQAPGLQFLVHETLGSFCSYSHINKEEVMASNPSISDCAWLQTYRQSPLFGHVYSWGPSFKRMATQYPSILTNPLRIYPWPSPSPSKTYLHLNKCS